MITPSFAFTATERVLPKLALDFTTASLDARVTFTRATGASNPATYVNSSGVLTAADNNQPRFDYDPIALTCKGLLIEESRSNMATYSSDLSNASWVKSNVNTTGTPAYVDVAVAPDNTQTADKFIPNSGQTAANFTKSIAITSGTTYCFSFFAKAAEQSKISLVSNVVTSYRVSVFDLSNGTVLSTASGWTSTIQNYGNGWYRCVSVFTATSSITAGFQISNNSAGWTGNGTSGIFIWGAQLEAGAFATSYIPTTTAALTRNADVAVMTGTNLTDWCDTTKGTILSQQAVAQFNAANTIYAYSLGSAAAVEIYAGMSTAGANQFTVINTTNQANFSGFSAGTLNTPQKVCGYYQANKFAASANGVAGGTDVSGTVPTINKLVFGARNDGARVLNGWIQKFSYWPFTLTTSEVTAFSK